MAKMTIEVRADVAWWYWPLVKAWAAWVFVTGRMPSDATISRVNSRAIKVIVTQ